MTLLLLGFLPLSIASIIIFSAVLWSALIIISVKRRKELQRASNILLSSMAVTDPLVGSFCVPLSAVVGLLASYQVLADHYICKLDFVALSSMVTLTLCSVFHLTMIAWERYMAIGKWRDYKVRVTRSLTKKLSIIAWILAIVTVSPPHFITLMRRENDIFSLALEIFFIILSVSVMFALCLIIYFYVMVCLGVRKRKLCQIRQVNELVNAKLEHRVAMTTVLVAFASILSFFPTILGGILQGIYPVFRQRLVVRVEDTFLYLNSVVNPLIYCYRDCRFKNAELETLRIRRPKVEPFVVMTNAASSRHVRQNDISGSGKDKPQIQKAKNPGRLTRSASLELVFFSDQTHLGFQKTVLKRPLSSPSLWLLIRNCFYPATLGLQQPTGHCRHYSSDPDVSSDVRFPPFQTLLNEHGLFVGRNIYSKLLLNNKRTKTPKHWKPLSSASCIFFLCSKGTDGKLLLLKVSISSDCSSLGCLKCVQFYNWWRLILILGDVLYYYVLLCKHQWNTRWVFARKHYIFTREKITVAMFTY